MAVYHYKDSPLVDRIEINSPRPNVKQAVIFTKDGASAEQLEQLRMQLGAHKFSTLMDTVDGRPVIQVRGIKDGNHLLAVMGTLAAAQGPADKTLTAEDRKKPEGFRSRVRGKTIFLSSIFYHLGNIAFIISGLQRGKHNPDGKMTAHDKSEIKVGLAFGLGDVLMTIYGKDRGDEELEAASQGLKRHLHQKGIEIPEGDALNPDSLHQSGALKATDRWLRKHVTHIKCLTELGGGLFTIHAALKPIKTNGQVKGNYNTGKLLAGLLISTGWLATFLLDKPRGYRILDGDPPTDTIGQKMKANPRGMIARPSGMANNLFNLWGSLNPRTGERALLREELAEAAQLAKTSATPANLAHLAQVQSKQHDYIWNVLSACSFLVAHTLFGLSGSKNLKETEDDKSMLNDLVLLSANVLANQPETVREQSIAETAQFVSKLAHVTLPQEQIADAIRDKVNGLSHSTWAHRVQQPPATGPQATV